jgi:tRNA (guanine-N7-)-methyltransferase
LRQRHIKAATDDFLESAGVIIKPKRIEHLKKPVFLEIGSGKGQFITSLAKDHPNQSYIAMEMNRSVLYRIVLKKIDEKLNNLTIILGDAKDLNVYFDLEQFQGIYLNFSDPWPKAKHIKRRLTSPQFLEQYQNLLAKKGFIQVRTDHTSFFEYSLQEIHGLFDIKDVQYQLKPSNYMTEYEIKKRKIGPIYQLIAEVDKNA